MKLICNLRPRTDGAIQASGFVPQDNGKPKQYTFTRASRNDPFTCEIDEEDVPGFLALTRRFQPADEADYTRAGELIAEAEEKRREAERQAAVEAKRKADRKALTSSENPDPLDDDDEEDPEDDDDPNAQPSEARQPIEAKTPPKKRAKGQGPHIRAER